MDPKELHRYVRLEKRFCDSQPSCDVCPLFKRHLGGSLFDSAPCNVFACADDVDRLAQIVQTVEEWGKSHPEEDAE